MKATLISLALIGLLWATFVSTQDQDTSSVISVQNNSNSDLNQVIQKPSINAQNDNSDSDTPGIGVASGGDGSNVAGATINGDRIADSGVGNENLG